MPALFSRMLLVFKLLQWVEPSPHEDPFVDCDQIPLGHAVGGVVLVKKCLFVVLLPYFCLQPGRHGTRGGRRCWLEDQLARSTSRCLERRVGTGFDSVAPSTSDVLADAGRAWILIEASVFRFVTTPKIRKCVE